MSFTTQHSAVVISMITNNTYELLDRQPQENETGWDTMKDILLVRNDTAGLNTTHALAGATFAAYDRGARASDLNMWVIARKATLLAWGLFKVEISYIGLLSPRGYKLTYDSAAVALQADSVTVAGTLYAKVGTREGDVTATLEYIRIDGTSPGSSTFPTAYTGQARTLPSGWAPYVPATVWTSLPVYRYNWPNGWVMEGAAMENPPGVSVAWLVKEKYRYQRDKTLN
jgi:hypothetical protein